MSATQIQIMSDLHLEIPKARPQYEEFEIHPQCPCLALLGDIGQVADNRLFEFLDRQLQHFETVLYLLGNHEPYGIDFPSAKQKMRDFQAAVELRRNNSTSPIPGKFVFLERTRYDLSPDVTILGCTLFSSIIPEQRDSTARFVSDFSTITDWTVDAHNAAHEADVQWLNAEVSRCAQGDPHRSIVILSHYSPTLLSGANDPKHIKDEDFQVRSAFSTDLSEQLCWTSSQVKVWAFGHTHFNCDVIDPQTKKRVVANQKGYSREGGFHFSSTKVLAIETVANPEAKASELDKPLLREGRAGRKHCTVS